MDLQSWRAYTNQWKISNRIGPNILIWGHSTSGIFSIKEAYYLQGNYHDQAKDTIWGKIWNSILCPKVSIFLWLIVQNHIFAWVILKKRGFIGPSIFLLFQQHEETMEHVFNHFHYNHTIWDLESQIMGRSNRNMNIINNTIENWDSITFQYPILARIWQFLSGFTLWKIWKERNKTIFHSKASPPTSTWDRIMNLIWETIKIRHWNIEDLKCSMDEQDILQNQHISLTDTPPSLAANLSTGTLTLGAPHQLDS